jgi:hypothetical protein
MICSVMPKPARMGLLGRGCSAASLCQFQMMVYKLHSSNFVTQIMHCMRISTLGTCAFSRYGTVTAADVHIQLVMSKRLLLYCFHITYNNGYLYNTNTCFHVSVGKNLISRQNPMRYGLHLREDDLKAYALCILILLVC